MPAQLTSPLPPIHPVRETLQATFADPSALASSRVGICEIEVLLEIEDVYNSNSWRVIGEYLNPYDYSTNTAKVTIHKALQGALTVSIPNFSVQGAQNTQGIIKRYRLRARDIVDGVPDSAFMATDPFIAWLAGNEYTREGQSLIAGKAYLFLTTRPLERKYHPSEKIHLQILPISSGTPTIRGRAVFEDGTDQTFQVTTGAVTPYIPFGVNMFPPAFEKQVTKIEFDITGLTGTAEKLTYKLISNPGPHFRQLFYLNSLGGLESLPLTGKCEETNENTGEVFEGQIYPPSNAQTGTSRAFNQAAQDGMILRTGFMSLADRKAIRDLTLRNDVYLLEGNSLRKMILTNATYTITKDGEYLNSAELTARFAYGNFSYNRA